MAVAGDQDVRGLDVAVHEPAGVGGVERGADLGDHLRRALRRERRERAQVVAVDEAHREVEQPVLLARLEHRQDVGVIDRGGQPRLGDEALAEARLARPVGGDQLERDRAAERLVGRLVDDPHPAAADEPQDPVAGDDRADQRPPTARAVAAAPMRSASAANAASIGSTPLDHLAIRQGVVEQPADRHQPAQERRVRDRPGALLDRRHGARDRRLQRPRARDRRGQLGLGVAEHRRGVAGGDHRRREEQVVADPDRHAVRLELHAQRAPERLDPRLGRAVGPEARGGQDGRGRGDQQQVPAAREHVRHRRPHRPPDAEQVDVDRLLDGLRSDEPQRPAGRDAGVGDRDVDPAEATPRGRRSRPSAPRHRARRRPRSRRLADPPQPPRAALG